MGEYQPLFLSLLTLIAGFIALLVGADQLVKGSSSLAKRFGVSSLVIGLTVVAFGSSAPELVVSLLATLRGSGAIAWGNVMGSNIANILLILGVSACIRPLTIGRAVVWREIPFAALSTGVALALAADTVLGGGANLLSRGEGVALLGLFLIFLYFTSLAVLQRRHVREEEEVVQETKLPIWRTVLMLVGGLAGLLIGGELIVRSAQEIALGLGLSPSFIALTVIAVGTSLPELAASGMAAYRGDAELAVGNIVGSVIFNVLWILGLSSVIQPIEIPAGGVLDGILALVTAVLLFPFMINGKRIGELSRREGGAFLLLYVVFLAFSLWRG